MQRVQETSGIMPVHNLTGWGGSADPVGSVEPICC